ncbi:MAG: glycine cleavage system aminomethyltransferase GcvT [Candidatus Omnitrophica bacterium]|nr:glycine cleavage system aminomethyltransferase GcvT [Candidatus Omnitrophota bacterium]
MKDKIDFLSEYNMINETCLKNTPLYSRHIGLGAKIVPFSGWNMPLQYSGIIEEHLQTRDQAGLFDICHMGEFILKGSQAGEDLEKLLTCRIDNLQKERCRYGFLLNGSGGIIDDLIVFKVSEEEFMLVVNAGTTEKDKKWIQQNISEDTVFNDISDRTAKLDIQGPLAEQIISKVTKCETVKQLKRFSFNYVEWNNIKILVSRTGYTGENGYELFCSAADAPLLWDAILKEDGVKPAGLGARDTLRMEMGYSLYGNDIDDDHTPYEANLMRFVYEAKNFTGKQAVIDQSDKGSTDLLAGFICEGRRSARKGFSVIRGDDVLGVVTSGAFSPCLKKGIGLCYINKNFSAENTDITLTDGKVEINAKIKYPPMFEK